MDGGRLYRLGRRLVELSRQSTGSPGDPVLTAGEEAVIEQVLRHPASTVRDIAERSGFVQSHVSASVAKLAERGLVDAATDPADRRRTLVTASPAVAAAVTTRAGRDTGDALRAALGQRRGARAAVLLDELAALLLDQHSAPAEKDRPSP